MKRCICKNFTYFNSYHDLGELYPICGLCNLPRVSNKLIKASKQAKSQMRNERGQFVKMYKVHEPLRTVIEEKIIKLESRIKSLEDQVENLKCCRWGYEWEKLKGGDV